MASDKPRSYRLAPAASAPVPETASGPGGAGATAA